MTENAIFFGLKIPILLGGSKRFGTHLTEKPPRHLITVFWSAIGPNGSKSQYLAKNTNFGPKLLIFMGGSKSFGTNITENYLDNLSALFFGQTLDQIGQKCRYLAQNASFGPNLAVFGPKIQFFGGRE